MPVLREKTIRAAEPGNREAADHDFMRYGIQSNAPGIRSKANSGLHTEGMHMHILNIIWIADVQNDEGCAPHLVSNDEFKGSSDRRASNFALTKMTPPSS